MHIDGAGGARSERREWRYQGGHPHAPPGSERPASRGPAVSRRRQPRRDPFQGAAPLKTLLRGSIHGVKDADSVLVDGDMITWVGRGQPPERPDDEVVPGPPGPNYPRFLHLQVTRW